MVSRNPGPSRTASVLPLPSRGPDSDRARHAVDLALRCLTGIQPAEDVLDLVDRAEHLRSEIEQWAVRPPSSEMREAVMRGALSIHIAALRLRSKR